MPCLEQFLYLDVDHFGPRDCAHCAPQEDMGPCHPEDANDTRDDAAADGKHQEFRRIQRGTPRVQPALYTLFRYVRAANLVSRCPVFFWLYRLLIALCCFLCPTGVYLTDLTFIEDGIPSIIKRTNLINFAKRAKTAEVIRDIQQYQNVAYSLQPVNELQDYILSNMQAAGDVHEMYDKSLQVEPREREDEKIVR